MNITNNQADFLITKYFQLLTASMKSGNNPTNLGLMSSDSVNDSMYAATKELFQSYCQLLNMRDKPLYKSRQQFLQSLFLNQGADIVYYSQTLENSSTCMAGSQEDDPFYDGNWKMASYIQNGEKYSKITNNLKARFFTGTQCDWQHFGNKACYIGTISFENISIERFNKVFSPCWDPEFFDGDSSKQSEFKNALSQLLSEVFIIEDFEASEYSQKYSRDDKDTTKNNLIEVINRAGSNYRIIFADEDGNDLHGYCRNIGHHTSMKTGDIVLINNKPRSVISIELTDNGMDGYYATVCTRERKDLEEQYFIL